MSLNVVDSGGLVVTLMANVHLVAVNVHVSNQCALECKCYSTHITEICTLIISRTVCNNPFGVLFL